jgi:hypothetical protein
MRRVSMIPGTPARACIRGCAAAALLVLGGCATPPKPPAPRYAAPTEGATARLVMRAALPTGDRYGVFVLDNADTCGGPRLVGIGDATHHPATTVLAADRLQTLEFRLQRADQKSCVIRWTFTPSPGKSYLFRGVGLPAACGAGLLDMSDPDHLRPEASALRRNPPGQSCLPIARSQGYGSQTGDHADLDGEAVLLEGAGAGDLQGLIGH